MIQLSEIVFSKAVSQKKEKKKKKKRRRYFLKHNKQLILDYADFKSSFYSFMKRQLIWSRLDMEII